VPIGWPLGIRSERQEDKAENRYGVAEGPSHRLDQSIVATVECAKLLDRSVHVIFILFW